MPARSSDLALTVVVTAPTGVVETDWADSEEAAKAAPRTRDAARKAPRLDNFWVILIGA